MNNYCNDNIVKLSKRIMKDFSVVTENKFSIDNLFSHNGKYIFLATGGSYIASVFCAKIINLYYGIFVNTMYPRDFLYTNYDFIDKVFIFSYSGHTSDLVEAVKFVPKEKIFVITKGQIDDIINAYNIKRENVISYYNDDNDCEGGFLTFEASIFSPMLLLNRINNKCNVKLLDRLIQKWDLYFDNIFKSKRKQLLKMFSNTSIVNIFSGDMTQVSALDVENKLTDSGICNCILHEKKNFSHGRYVIYENQINKYNIYFKRKEVDLYEKKLLQYLNDDFTLIIESEYNDILCEFDLLISSMILINHIGKLLNIDPSIGTTKFSGDELYKYIGSLK